MVQIEYDKIQVLNETGLSPAEMRKYPYRPELFAKKIRSGEPFTLTDETEIVVVKDEAKIARLEAGDFKGLKFTSVEGKEYKLSAFSKTVEFGEGKGSGGGSVDTARNESAQCLYLSVFYNVLDPHEIMALPDDHRFDTDQFNEAAKYIHVGKEKLDNMTNLPTAWNKSSIIVAKSLYKYLNLSNKKDWYFHKDSKLMNSIYAAKTKACKSQKIANLNNDKWNPGDIWMTDTEGDSAYSLPTNSLIKLNDHIKTLYKKRQLIGISLKKVVKIPTVQENNVEPTSIDYKFKDYILHPKSKDFFDNISVYFDLAGGDKIQFRNFNIETGWTGQISGKTAAGGKIGVKMINLLLKGVGIKGSLPSPTKLKKDMKSKLDAYYEEMFQLYLKYDQQAEIKNIDDFIKVMHKKLKGKELHWFTSKYIGMYLLDLLSGKSGNMSDPKVLKFINNMMQYASSTSMFSSVFLKVYEK